MKATSETVFTEVLIVGSGIAGLLLALKLSQAGASVVLACKGAVLDSNTSLAQGGIAAVLPASLADSPSAHLQDTVVSGAGLTDADIASQIIQEGALLIDDLGNFGVPFDRSDQGRHKLALEGGHSHARVVHNKDATGKAIACCLSSMIQEAHPGGGTATILEHACVIELIVTEGNCEGARLMVDGRLETVLAEHVVLATGGIGQLFERTTNPPVATGDGIALAYRAGARLSDMEFIQFHPTAFAKEGAPPFLISEAVRGAGAILLDRHGQRFAGRFHPKAELATRDIVSRGIHTIMQEQRTSCVLLDLRPIGSQTLLMEFPTIVGNCREYGLDPLIEPMPICPGALFHGWYRNRY